MSDRNKEEVEVLSMEGGLSPEEQVKKLESFIKDMKEEIKQLKKIGKHKEKIEKPPLRIPSKERVMLCPADTES
jgi:DNA-binding transcriptional regulator GbsR (MarR family)